MVPTSHTSVLPCRSNVTMCSLVEPHHCFKAIKNKYRQSCAGEKILAPPAGSLPLLRWASGPLRYPADWVPLHIRLKSSPMAPDTAPGTGGLRHHHVSHGTELTPREGGLLCHHVSSGSRPTSRCERALALPRVLWHRAHLPTEEGSCVAMCPTVPDPAPGTGGLWCRYVCCGTSPTS
jgi:hypothetical protein